MSPDHLQRAPLTQATIKKFCPKTKSTEDAQQESDLAQVLSTMLPWCSVPTAPDAEELIPWETR